MSNIENGRGLSDSIIILAPEKIVIARIEEAVTKNIFLYEAKNLKQARNADIECKRVTYYSSEEIISARRADLTLKIVSYAEQLEMLELGHGDTEEIRERLHEVTEQLAEEFKPASVK